MKKFEPIILGLLLTLVTGPLFASDENQQVFKKQEPLTREKSLVVYVTYGNGYIDIGKANAKNVFVGEFDYKNQKPDVRYEVVGDEGRLNVQFSGKLRKDSRDDESHNITSFKRLYDNDLTLNLSPDLPIDLDLELGVIKGKIDIGGLRIKNLKLEVGVSQSSILCSEPNPESLEDFKIEGGVGKLMVEKLGNANIRNFSFQGGVGSYVLDFGGKYQQDMHANIEIGMGKVKLYLPKYVGTRIEVDKSFLSSFSIDEAYKKGDFYYNDQWEKTPYMLDMKVEAGVGKVDIIWVED